MTHLIEQQTFGEERALYALKDATVRSCTFAGEEDGESALKECRNIRAEHCHFELRYPLWHAVGFTLEDSAMEETCRAPMWYTEKGELIRCRIDGVKALRECDRTYIKGCTIHSPEFGWRCRGVELEDTTLDAVYCLFESRDITAHNLRMSGKYSFQYTENLTITDSVLDTKDAFWHAKNVTVKNSVVKGEYLGWFSDGLTLIDCKISGTQPLCYCKNLRLINCTMEETDLSFEYSDVEADVKGEILSVKNPRSGRIVADRIGDIIWEGSIMESTCKIETRNF